MFRRASHSAGIPIAPRAVFSRPIEYFSVTVEEAEDGLDKYKAAYYSSGNDLYFEIRKYLHHPEYSSTLYLSIKLGEDEIFPTIKLVADTFDLPWNAVIWFWNEDVSNLRPILVDNSRLSEKEARELVLKAAARNPNRTVSMQQIREGVATMYPLSRADQIRSKTRPAEQLWQQILRNVVSHRSGVNSIFAKGLAEKVGNGIRITNAGLSHLKRSGFLS